VRATTRVTLIRLRAALLGCAVLTLVTSYLAVTGVVDTAVLVRDRTSQAILAVAAARDALVSADAAAVSSFASGEAKLAGPGQDYENEMAAASQSLAQVAEFNQADESAGGAPQVVAGLVTAYASAMGQADAHFRQPGSAVVGLADLWYASRLLHAPGGVLAQLTDLQAQERAALDRQLAGDGMSAGLLPLWLLPPVLLLVLLVLTQLYLRRRFRRRLNPLLLGASVLTAGVVVALSATLGLAGGLDDVRDRVDQALAVRQAEVAATDANGQAGLANLVRQQCGPAGCGSTVDDFEAAIRPVSAAPDATDRVAAAVKAVTAQAASATESGGLPVLVPVGVVLAAGLVVSGLYRRIDEYRYEA
jgi:hypothetical protein